MVLHASASEALQRAVATPAKDGDLARLAGIGISRLNGSVPDPSVVPDRVQPSGIAIWRDSAGHHRPVYNEFAAWLLRDVLSLSETAPADAATKPRTIDVQLWSALMAVAQGSAEAQTRIDELISRPGRAGSLHVLEDDASLDMWTFHELSGLHALFNAAATTGRVDWLKRCDEIADFHLYHTQPDNATGQPWAVGAFARRIDTITFAEQQLHDATAYDGRIKPLAALLMADAWVTLQTLHAKAPMQS